MEYNIQYGSFAFAVPGNVVDHFLRLAGEKEIKVLLLLLRYAPQYPAAETIAEFLRIPAEAAQEALDFWMQAGILSAGNTQTLGQFPFAAPDSVRSTPPSVPAASPASAESPIQTVGAQRSSKEIKLDPSEIALEIEKHPDLAAVFSLAEKKIGRPLNHMEQRSLLWQAQYLNIPGEVILMLIEYCVSIEKYSISYAESIAIRWHSEGILDLEHAEAEITRLTQEHTFVSEIRKRFELRRSPTSRQRGYIDLWQKAGYPLDLIGYAYEITVENIDKADFKYINTILEGWAAEGIRDVGAAKAQREASAGKRKAAAKTTALSEREIDEMNDYLSVVNRFKEVPGEQSGS